MRVKLIYNRCMQNLNFMHCLDYLMVSCVGVKIYISGCGVCLCDHAEKCQ